MLFRDLKPHLLCRLGLAANILFVARKKVEGVFRNMGEVKNKPALSGGLYV